MGKSFVRHALASLHLKQFGEDADGIIDRIEGRVIAPTIRPKVDTSAWDNWVPKVKIAGVTAHYTGGRQLID